MAKKKRHEEHEEHENSERWLLSYSDFITLLMVFFLIMYSMSMVDAQKFEALAASLSGVFSGSQGVMEGGMSVVGDTPSGAVEETTTETEGENAAELEQQDLQELADQLNGYLEEQGLDDLVTSVIDERGLVVSLGDSALFDTGSALIKTEFMSSLVQIAKTVDMLDHFIRVEGHTDNIPVHNTAFNSNWELSSLRATTVVELMVEQAGVDPGKLSAVGYGEFRPKADNATPEGRAQNRRVDIIVVRNQYNGIETVVDGAAAPSEVDSPGVEPTTAEAS